LAKSQLDKIRIEITNEELENCYKQTSSIQEVIKKNEEDCKLSLQIMQKL